MRSALVCSLTARAHRCVVELHAAIQSCIQYDIAVVIRAGKAVRDGDAMRYDTEGATAMLENLSRMIDVEKAQCVVPADRV